MWASTTWLHSVVTLYCIEVTKPLNIVITTFSARHFCILLQQPKWHTLAPTLNPPSDFITVRICLQGTAFPSHYLLRLRGSLIYCRMYAGFPLPLKLYIRQRITAMWHIDMHHDTGWLLSSSHLAYCKTRNGLRNGLIPRTHRKWKYALISCRNDHWAGLTLTSDRPWMKS